LKRPNPTSPDNSDLERLLKTLTAFVNTSKLEPVELAARAHYLFEKIHPFGDGNGRIGRLLMNYILWRNGYPMLIIEYKKRKPYYKALERTEETFVTYFTRRYISVHQKRLSNSPTRENN
jgi:Fic family protein